MEITIARRSLAREPPAQRTRTLTLQYIESARKPGCSTFAVGIHLPVK